MSAILAALTILYAVGVVWALIRTDARTAERIVLSVLWPLGPLAFLVTIAILLAASVVPYPVVMIPALVVVALLWWALL